jgi:thymidylate synthase (FAD)
VPVACQAFRDYRLGAVTLSAQMLGVVRRLLAGESVVSPPPGLSMREWLEMREVLKLPTAERGVR